MRKILVFLLVMLFFFLIFKGKLLVFSLQQNEASISLSWSKLTYYQGDNGALSITFSSKSPEELKISMIEIRFNWTKTMETLTIDLSEDPVGIPSNDDHTFDPILFQVPQNASEGPQNVIISIKGMQHGLLWYDFEWISSSEVIEVKTNYQQLFTELEAQVLTNLNEIRNANYENDYAINLLDNAELEYNLAISLANQNRWEEAVSHLQQSQDYLDQAQEKEQQLTVDEFTATLITIIILIIIGLLIAVILGRKTRN